MKKVALILLICIYSLGTMGFSLKQFYCCGKLKSITLSLAIDTKQKCSKGDAKGCCDNKYLFFKVKDTHISADKISNPANHFTDLHIYTPTFCLTAFAVQRTSIANSTHAPPLIKVVPVYISNCVFRI